jgi:hypothetical protein
MQYKEVCMDSLACLVTFGLWAAATVGIAWQRIRAEANTAAAARDLGTVRNAWLAGTAYGWPHDRSDDELLALLVALNRERAARQSIVIECTTEGKEFAPALD